MSEEKRYYFDKYTSKELFGYYDEPAKKIPIINNIDVLVVGGSQSGVAAAISAARGGAKVQLVERFGFLGGQSVYGMVTQWEKRAFINNLGAVLTKGLPKEMLDRVIEKGGSDGLWKTPPGCPEMRDGEEWINPEAIKVTFIEMCEEEGIELLFHTSAVDVIVENQIKSQNNLPKLTGVIFENKSGRFAIKAKIIIDATADLDLIWRAIGENGCGIREPKDRMGSGFYIWYGGINNEKYIDWYLRNPDSIGGYPDPKKYPDKVRKHIDEGKLIKISGNTFSQILEKAEKLGMMDKIEDILEKAQIMGFITLGMKWVGNDRWCCYFTGINEPNMLDAWKLTKLEIFRTKLDFYMLPIMRLIPGWENAYISRENLYLGSRETRWLKAMTMIDQTLIWDPQNAINPTPPDTIGRSGAHDPGKNRVTAGYPIPYGIIVPEKLDGVLVCCRSVGTKPDRALDAHRGITPTMVVGQGAGTAAALLVKLGVEPRNLDAKILQNTLRKDGVQLDHESIKFDFEILKDRSKKKFNSD